MKDTNQPVVNYGKYFPGALFAQAQGKRFVAIYKERTDSKNEYSADVRVLNHDARKNCDDFVDFRSIDTITIPVGDAMRAIRHVARKGCVFDVLAL